MKNFYEQPEIEITVFDDEKILARSSVFDSEGRIELPFVPANQ